MQNANPSKVTLIINGRYNLPVRIQRELTQLCSSDFCFTQLTTTRQKGADELAKQAINDGCDLIVVCGGDGTLNEVVNGVMWVDEQLRTHLALAILPIGRGNDFSRVVGDHTSRRTTLTSIIDHFQRHATRKVDLGLLRFQTPENQQAQRYFINICDIGVGGYVSERVNRIEKWMGAALAYHLAIIQGLLNYRNTAVTVVTNTGEWRGELLNLVLANGRYFGHGLGIAPQAELCDGQIQMVRLGKISLFDYFRNLGKLKRCESIAHPEAHYQKITQCHVVSALPVPVDMDGEFIGYTPVNMTIKPAAIEIVFLDH